ncbi:hypothetical protein M9458_030606, partial [Cirrhinus mrigala]
MEGGARMELLKERAREEQMEGGARTELLKGGGREVQMEGGARSRRNQVGPRPQPGRRPMVETIEGGAMVEVRLAASGGQQMEAERVGEESRVETESCRARAVERIQRAKALTDSS